MQKKFPLNELGKVLRAYIKDGSPHSLTEVGKQALGITYSNFQKRLSENNLRTYELEKILSYLGLEASLVIGDMEFQNEHIHSTNTPVSYEKRMEKEERILKLEERQLELRRHNLSLQKAIDQLKQEINKE